MEEKLDEVRRDIQRTRASMGRKIYDLKEKIAKRGSAVEGLGVLVAGGWLAARLIKKVWRRKPHPG